MLILLLIVALPAGAYYLSLLIHPTIKCKGCDKRNRYYKVVYADHRARACPDCKGTGRTTRLGVRLFIGRR